MSDAEEQGLAQQAVAEQAAAADGPPVSRFEVVPTRSGAPEAIFTHRAPEPPAEADAAAKKAPPMPSKPMLILGGVTAVGALVAIVLGVQSAVTPKPPVQYIDLGTQRFDPAGLGGRLIVRWEGNAEYQLSLDPLDQSFVPGFEAVAQDPPRPLSLTLRLRNAEGLVICQKEILFPPPAAPPVAPAAAAPAAAAQPDPAQALQPQKTPSGDTVQNVAGQDNHIAEIAISGGLPCPAKAYSRLTAWDFTTNFPTLAEQQEWQKHEVALTPAAKAHKASGLGGLVQHLPTPIEGDDVIVADNPSRGTVETSAGRTFLVGTNLRTRGAEWQEFPAAVHYRCDRNGSCLLTRPNSHSMLQVRLLR
jgi:hypothetical protein